VVSSGGELMPTLPSKQPGGREGGREGGRKGGREGGTCLGVNLENVCASL